MEGRTQDKKDSTINTFHWFFFPSQNKKVTIHRKMRPLFTYLVFVYKFLQQSHVSAGLDGFYRPGPHQPVWPYTRRLSRWFSMELHTRGLTRHIITSINTQLERNAGTNEK